MTQYDPKKHHRRSMRLQGYNYAQPGAYFITLVAYQRENLFGEVVNGEMQLSALGKIVYEEWLRSNHIRREICLNEDEFVIMPNHKHGIVWIVEPDNPVGADGIRPADTPPGHNAPIGMEGASLAPLPETRPGPRLLPRSLSSFIAGFKSAVTSRAGRELDMTGIWQRNYYDHIIRNGHELQRLWDYIDTNPQRWLEDRLHPSAPPNRFNQN